MLSSIIQAQFHPEMSGIEIIVKNLGSNLGFDTEFSVPWIDPGGIICLQNETI